MVAETLCCLQRFSAVQGPDTALPDGTTSGLQSSYPCIAWVSLGNSWNRHAKKSGKALVFLGTWSIKWWVFHFYLCLQESNYWTWYDLRIVFVASPRESSSCPRKRMKKNEYIENPSLDTLQRIIELWRLRRRLAKYVYIYTYIYICPLTA